jgi:Rrf2 family protein
MKLTRASSYALHALVFMASQKQQNKPVTFHDIAKARSIPEKFLLKILKPLVSARVLYSIKGPKGGYRLARSAHEISMLEVIEAVDGPLQGIAPLSQTQSDGNLDRKLQLICNQTAEQLRKHLHKVRIAELSGK